MLVILRVVIETIAAPHSLCWSTGFLLSLSMNVDLILRPKKLLGMHRNSPVKTFCRWTSSATTGCCSGWVTNITSDFIRTAVDNARDITSVGERKCWLDVTSVFCYHWCCSGRVISITSDFIRTAVDNACDTTSVGQRLEVLVRRHFRWLAFAYLCSFRLRVRGFARSLHGHDCNSLKLDIMFTCRPATKSVSTKEPEPHSHVQKSTFSQTYKWGRENW